MSLPNPWRGDYTTIAIKIFTPILNKNRIKSGKFCQTLPEFFGRILLEIYSCDCPGTRSWYQLLSNNWVGFPFIEFDLSCSCAGV
jgi:hypothetical protein